MAYIRRAAAPIVTRITGQACNRIVVRPAFARSTLPSASKSSRIGPSHASVRWHSAPASASKVYEYDQIRALSESPSEDRILIDVREPHEYQDGYIPSAINIPIKSQPDAFFLPAEEFEDRFGFSKPQSDQEVVFYCKSGVRSSAAANLAQQVGYKNVAEYRGSWLDWQKNGGTANKP